MDGVTSGNVSLTEQSYASGADLAAELETKINADTAISGAGKHVTVDYDPSVRFFNIDSTTLCNSSSVAVTSAAAPVNATLGLFVGTGIRGHAGTTAADAAANSQVKVLGGATGARGQLTVVRGVMSHIADLFGEVLGTNGVFDNRLSALNNQLAAVDKEAAAFQTQIDALQARLQASFTAADSAISQLNSTASFLTQQLAANTANKA